MPKLKEGTLLAKEEIILDREVLRVFKEKGLSLEQLADIKRIVKKTKAFRITYQSNGHRVNGFLIAPRAIRGTLPCIIWNRGGIGEFGAITLAAVFRSMGRMAEWGYVVIATQYSGNGGSEGADDCGGPETLNDVLNLKKVLEQIPTADISRIGMYGWSRGGMMTYLSLANVKWIKAAVTMAGLADVARSVKRRPALAEAYKELWKVTPKNIHDRSAVRWPEKFSKKAPILLLHGTADWRVTVQDSLDLTAALVKEKVPCRLVVFEGDDHGITANAKERYRLTHEWFDRFVKNGEPLPNLTPHGD